MRYTRFLVMMAIILVFAIVGTWSLVHFLSPVQKPIELRILNESDGPELAKAKKMISDSLKK